MLGFWLIQQFSAVTFDSDHRPFAPARHGGPGPACRLQVAGGRGLLVSRQPAATYNRARTMPSPQRQARSHSGPASRPTRTRGSAAAYVRDGRAEHPKRQRPQPQQLPPPGKRATAADRTAGLDGQAPRSGNRRKKKAGKNRGAGDEVSLAVLLFSNDAPDDGPSLGMQAAGGQAAVTGAAGSAAARQLGAASQAVRRTSTRATSSAGRAALFTPSDKKPVLKRSRRICPGRSN